MILVTGGAGLLGSELIRQLLAKGNRVRAIYNKTSLPDFNTADIEQFPCNILDVTGLEEAMQDVEQVYHCAAIVSFDPAQKRELFKINIEGTANVVNAALITGVKKMVHVSSVAAIGKGKGGKYISEEMNWTEETSDSNYAQSKYLGELEVWRGIGEGLNAVIINPSIILGAGDWNDGSSRLFKSVYDEFPWYSEGENGFVDVRDAATAMIELMNSEISAERFILSAANESYRKLFEQIANAFGKTVPSKLVTPFIAGVVWRLEAIRRSMTGKKPLITRETAHNALSIARYDNSKLLKFLPDFKYHSLEDTIVHTCAAMKKMLKDG